MKTFWQADANEVATTIAEMAKNRLQVEDKTTGSDLRWELNKLIDIRDFHDQKAARYRSELPEIEHGLAKKNEALKLYQSMNPTPRVLSDIDDVEKKIESLEYDKSQLDKVIAGHEGLRDNAIKNIEAFDHSRLAELEAREKILDAAGV